MFSFVALDQTASLQEEDQEKKGRRIGTGSRLSSLSRFNRRDVSVEEGLGAESLKRSEDHQQGSAGRREDGDPFQGRSNPQSERDLLAIVAVREKERTDFKQKCVEEIYLRCTFVNKAHFLTTENLAGQIRERHSGPLVLLIFSRFRCSTNLLID
jgi:hypothetical protein